MGWNTNQKISNCILRAISSNNSIVLWKLFTISGCFLRAYEPLAMGYPWNKEVIFFFLKAPSNRVRTVYITRHKIYCRPILDYASSVWSPYKLQDSGSLEQIQRAFTSRAFLRSRHVPSYDECLRLTGLTTLATRWLLTDLTTAFSIIRGFFSPLSSHLLFALSHRNSSSRTHNYKLIPNLYW